MSLDYVLTDDPANEPLKTIADGLSAYNESLVGPPGRRSITVFARQDADEVVAGLSGFTAWGWLYVQWLWVSQSHRGRGVAATLLARAEAEAVARNCHGAWIDTFNPAALRVYRKAGYEPFGALEDFPMGHTRTFLKKRLSG